MVGHAQRLRYMFAREYIEMAKRACHTIIVADSYVLLPGSLLIVISKAEFSHGPHANRFLGYRLRRTKESGLKEPRFLVSQSLTKSPLQCKMICL